MKRRFTISKHWMSVLLLLLMGWASAQSKVSGVVTDGEDGSTLPGVSVVIKGTTTGTVSDLDGRYSLTVPDDESVLVFSFVGYLNEEVNVNGRSSIDVSLSTDLKQLEEVVVVGYGTQRKKEVTGAVASLKTDAIVKTPSSDLNTAMQGQIAGVNVQSADGRPGAPANIQIRGIGSLNGESTPLYVVDGVPFQGIPNIPPEQIESVDVLKDGASAAIYGVRASNGVILITTKRGAPGVLNVSATAYKGVQNITSGTPLMNASEQMYVEDISLNAEGREPAIFVLNKDAADFDSDFIGDVTNNNAAIENYSVSVSGGSGGLNLSANTTYFKQDGVLISSGFDRISNRITADFTKNRLKVFSSVAFTTENTQQEPYAMYLLAMSQKPYQRGLFDVPEVGENSWQLDGDNEILYSYIARQLENEDERTVNTSNVALNLQYEILDGLKYRVNFGRNSYNYKRKFFQPQYLVYDRNGDFSPTASRPEAILNYSNIESSRNVLENVVTYDRTFGDHKVGALLGVTYEAFQSASSSYGVIGLLSNDTRVLSAGSAGIQPSGTETRNTLAGKLARVQYAYGDRYFLSANFRRDGSSNFGPGNKYENFFGISGGWSLSDEAFFQSLGADFVSSLKLRASYGRVGNQNIGAYGYAPVIESGSNYIYGPDEVDGIGAIQRGYANADLRWETSISENIGMDAEFLKGKLNLTVDVYKNSKQDMLLPELLAPSTGTWHPRGEGYLGYWNTVDVNAGNMENKGLEVSLKYREQTSFGLNFNAGLTFTRNRNKVTDLNGAEGLAFSGGRPINGVNGIADDPTTFISVGHEAGAFFLIESAGIIKNEEQLEAYRAYDAGARLGDMMFVDANGDSVINDLDRVYMGSGQPKFELGSFVNLEYKGFDLFVQGYYVHDVQIYNGAKLYAYAIKRHKDLYYQWTPQNATSDVPASRGSSVHNNIRSRTDVFLEDGTYFRIRNITLGYTLPKRITKDKLGKVRVYLSSMNPFTFTQYTGYDPEVGGDGLYTRGVDRGTYPVSRRFLGGLQIEF
ncbi:SusC/RagA family TonB-linked outer membrane protein [Marinoscillum furvescens]|nr:TonB-dependent receptor [Marinoscillum furvescens]